MGRPRGRGGEGIDRGGRRRREVGGGGGGGGAGPRGGAGGGGRGGPAPPPADLLLGMHVRAGCAHVHFDHRYAFACFFVLQTIVNTYRPRTSRF